MSNELVQKLIPAGGEPLLPAGCGLVIKPQNTCCFTGHRPAMLPDGGDPDSPAMKKLAERIKLYIDLLSFHGVDTFIIGMSRGFDLLAAKLITDDDRLCERSRIICALPYRVQINEMKTEEEKQLYLKTLVMSEAAVYFYDEFCDGCYKVRNRFMVEYSGALIGYLKNEELTRTGSLQTVNLAKAKNRKLYITYESETAQ